MHLQQLLLQRLVPTEFPVVPEYYHVTGLAS